MPNWCSNYLHVEGDLNELQHFKTQVLTSNIKDSEELQFTMEFLYPTPKELLDQTSPIMWTGEEDDEEGKKEFEAYTKFLEEQYGHTDWYNWRVANWGTKWDCDTFNVDEFDGDALGIGYSTAWSPNEGFIKYASSIYKNLKFRLLYEEPGMGFCGILVCENGEVIEENTADLQWIDSDTDRLVTYDGELERWRYIDNDEVIDDEDFYPTEYNGFNN